CLRRKNATSCCFEGRDVRAHSCVCDRLLQAPAMRRWWRGEQLESLARKVCEAGRIGDRGCSGSRRLRRAASVEIGQRSRWRQVRNAHLLGKGFDSVQLGESPGCGGCVIVPNLLHSDDRDALAAESPQLSRGHRGRDQVAWPCQTVNVGVQASGPPGALELESFLLEGQLEGVDRRVE